MSIAIFFFVFGFLVGYGFRRYWSERKTVNPYWPKKYFGFYKVKP